VTDAALATMRGASMSLRIRSGSSLRIKLGVGRKFSKTMGLLSSCCRRGRHGGEHAVLSHGSFVIGLPSLSATIADDLLRSEISAT
jgi:hypothetical protein